MSKRTLRSIALLACFALVAHADEVLDNAAIVRMVRAGLSTDIVVMKIERTAGRYDLSADGLIALKNAGVADSVIKAMMTKAESAPPAPPASPTPPAPPAAAQPATAAQPADPTCVDVRYYTLGNDGWSWVPSYVCAGTSGFSIDQQNIALDKLTAQCREKQIGLAFGGSDNAEWWISDGTDTHKFRGTEREISDIEAALKTAKPSLPHGSCSDRNIRAKLAGKP